MTLGKNLVEIVESYQSKNSTFGRPNKRKSIKYLQQMILQIACWSYRNCKPSVTELETALAEFEQSPIARGLGIKNRKDYILRESYQPLIEENEEKERADSERLEKIKGIFEPVYGECKQILSKRFGLSDDTLKRIDEIAISYAAEAVPRIDENFKPALPACQEDDEDYEISDPDDIEFYEGNYAAYDHNTTTIQVGKKAEDDALEQSAKGRVTFEAYRTLSAELGHAMLHQGAVGRDYEDISDEVGEFYDLVSQFVVNEEKHLLGDYNTTGILALRKEKIESLRNQVMFLNFISDKKETDAKKLIAKFRKEGNALDTDDETQIIDEFGTDSFLAHQGGYVIMVHLWDTAIRHGTTENQVAYRLAEAAGKALQNQDIDFTDREKYMSGMIQAYFQKT